jgi:hypothetical protein
VEAFHRALVDLEDYATGFLPINQVMETFEAEVDLWQQKLYHQQLKLYQQHQLDIERAYSRLVQDTQEKLQQTEKHREEKIMDAAEAKAAVRKLLYAFNEALDNLEDSSQVLSGFLSIHQARRMFENTFSILFAGGVMTKLSLEFFNYSSKMRLYSNSNNSSFSNNSCTNNSCTNNSCTNSGCTNNSSCRNNVL